MLWIALWLACAVLGYALIRLDNALVGDAWMLRDRWQTIAVSLALAPLVVIFGASLVTKTILEGKYFDGPARW